MPDDFEKIAGVVYKKWRMSVAKDSDSHPDEEALSCFLEGKLSFGEIEQIKAHLFICEKCAEIIAMSLKVEPELLDEGVPEDLLNRVKERVSQAPLLFKITLRLKQKALEIINTTGDILADREFIPAPILRARKFNDFKDEVTIFKDFDDLKVEAKIESKSREAFNLVVVIKQKQDQEALQDLRVTLFEAGIELESYLAESGVVNFGGVKPGKYAVEISNLEGRAALVVLEIEVL